MKKRLTIMIIALAVVFGGIFGWKAFVGYKIRQAMAHMQMPPVAVSTATVQTQDWSPETHAVASLTAVQGVDITPQLPGAVTHIYFHSGQEVKAGALLIQIDNSNQLAQLQHDLAQQRLAEANLRRDRELIANKAISQAQLDADEATHKSALASVANDRATLDKLAIRAPFSGHLGVRQVNLGQYVAPGTPIVNLQSWDPLYVDFTIPQSEIGQISIGMLVRVQTDAYPGEIFTGKVRALGSAVNTATRQLDVQAAIPNPQGKLRPGMFAEVDAVGSRPHTVIAIPDTAITYNTYGDFVYVVESKTVNGKTQLVAVQRVVRTGAQRGEYMQILSGLRPGETVVTAGQVKLRNGMPVVVNNTAQP